MTVATLPTSHQEAAEKERQNAVWLFATFVGGALILNSYLARWFLETDLPPGQSGIVSGLCALVGAILLAAPLVIRAGKELAQGHLYIGELAALAVLACFATKAYQEAGLVAFFLMLAELLESRTALGARAAVEGLIRLTPKQAHKIEDDKEVDVPLDRLHRKDRIRVRPGENVPADGLICMGETSLNEASVTGESLPVDRRPGETVFAGTTNLTGAIEVEVTKVGADTTLGRVQNLILQAERTKLPLMRLIDKYVHWYTPAVVMIAAVILLFTKNPTSAITALVVSCPCALVLATPTAMVAGLTCAARLGILVKNVAHLESAGNITALVVDKTGTLTTGELAVTRLAPREGVEAADLLHMAGSADRHSNHPAARALIKVAQEARVPLSEPVNLQEFGGKGVEAQVDGETLRVGRRSWLVEQGVDLNGIEEPSRKEEEGYSTIYVARGDTCIGWIGMVDRTRPEARRATEDLQALGIRSVTMVTGDRWGVARRVAGELGCTDVLAQCLPEQKLELVEDLKRRGLRVAVIGDGVNDAPALAAGDLGVAMGAAGNDIAINSASIALLSNDLGRLPFLVRLSRQVRRVVVQNLIFGAIFVVAGLTASGMELLTPVVAAVLHLVSSFLVIFNSARIVRFGEELAPHLPGEPNAS